jgi:hypothetical protein
MAAFSLADLARLTRCLLRCRSGIQGSGSRSSRCRRSPHDCRRIRADVSRSGGSFRVDRSGVASTFCRGCRQTRVSCDGSPFSRLHRPRAGLNRLRVCQHSPKVASHRSNPPQHGSEFEAQPAISDGTKQWGWGARPPRAQWTAPSRSNGGAGKDSPPGGSEDASVSDKIQFGRQFVQAMTANPNFPGPTPSLWRLWNDPELPESHSREEFAAQGLGRSRRSIASSISRLALMCPPWGEEASIGQVFAHLQP